MQLGMAEDRNTARAPADALVVFGAAGDLARKNIFPGAGAIRGRVADDGATH